MSIMASLSCYKAFGKIWIDPSMKHAVQKILVPRINNGMRKLRILATLLECRNYLEV
jgi:hypothetical protein